MLITSLKNPRITALARLREGRHRRKQGRILIDGARESLRAATAGVPLLELWCCPELAASDEARELISRQPLLTGCELFTVPPAIFAKLAYGDRADGIISVAQPQLLSPDEFDPGPQPLLGVLSGVEKPGNVGAVFRSADGAGMSGLLLADPRTDLHNPLTIRAAMGTVFRLPALCLSGEATRAWLIARQLPVYVAALTPTAVDYTTVDYRASCAIVLGSEDKGVDPAWLTMPGVTPIAIPMLGQADSLNVSAAAAVLFYEARRQRNARS